MLRLISKFLLSLNTHTKGGKSGSYLYSHSTLSTSVDLFFCQLLKFTTLDMPKQWQMFLLKQFAVFAKTENIRQYEEETISECSYSCSSDNEKYPRCNIISEHNLTPFIRVPVV
ncbi:CLUMA_CG008762, isoform A [Clunio marinus]|uniref:CLUMA_CG008762, isoform A n=1 Tax=Clunio marinus TaxID=568069 RepID=A0A1J1IA34_9DIPT|nr:CLUMA_CG008762, isoform A [Clunio marinus]